MKTFSFLRQYVDDMPSSIPKKDFILDYEKVMGELDLDIFPFYDNALPKFNSTVYGFTDPTFKKEMKHYKKSTDATIGAVIDMLQGNRELIVSALNKEFGDPIMKVTLDHYKLNILRYVENITFFNRYASSWIIAVVAETGNKSKLNLPLFPSDKECISFAENHENMTRFIMCCDMYGMPFDTFLNSIKNLKGHLYNDLDGDATSAYSAKIDPYGFGILPVRFNPVYLIGKTINTWRVQHHEKNKQELKKFTLIVLGLEEEKNSASNKEQTASIEKQIKYYANEINRLTTAIHRTEEND